MAGRKGTVLRIDSSSVQDYVKAIYGFTEWQETPITASQLAVRMSVANSSVTGMVAKLVELGLARHEKYGPISLTPAGLALALAMVRRHRLIETFLVDQLGYSWDEVHDEAELLEHSVSDTFVERLDRKLGHPARDPHGDPIPTPDGVVPRPDAVPLARLDDGHRARVARISDDNPALLKFLTDHGVGLDTPLLVSGRAPFGGLLAVAVGENPRAPLLQLGEELVAALWVKSLGTHEGCTLAAYSARATASPTAAAANDAPAVPSA